MAFRDRTGLFLSFRAACDHQTSQTLSRFSREHPEDREGLLEGINEGDTVIEMDILPPQWVDTTDEVDEFLVKIRGLCAQLEPMHKKHALPGFEDRTAEEKDIERLTADITSLFHRCYTLIKKIERQTTNGRDIDRIMCKNVTQAIAAKVSAENGKFRKNQSAYLARLRARPSLKSPVVADEASRSIELERGHVQSQQQAQRQAAGRHDTLIEQREREIDEIARSITEVADIFKELNTMVIDQGTTLDRIDYNIDNMHVNMQAASQELVKAENYQSRSRKRKLMLLLVLMIFAVIIILIYKPTSRQIGISGPSTLPSYNDVTGDVASIENGDMPILMPFAQRRRLLYDRLSRVSLGAVASATI